VAQGGSRAGGEDGSGGSLERDGGWTADGVDAAEDSVEAAGLDRVANRVLAHSERPELLSGDVSVLGDGDLGD
jgi:hypothetical protein